MTEKRWLLVLFAGWLAAAAAKTADQDIKACEEAVKLATNADEKVEALLKLGPAQYRAASPDDATAFKTIQSAIDLPDSTPKQKADAYLIMADLYSDWDAFEKACRQAAAVPGLTPRQKLDAYRQLSIKFTSWGIWDYPAALKVLNEALAIKDLGLVEQLGLMRQIGGTQQALGRYEDARQTYRKIMSLPNADIAGTWMLMAGTYLAPVQYMTPPSPEAYREAIACYQEVLKLEKGDKTGAWLGLADAWLALNDSEKALAAARQISDNPKAGGNALCQALGVIGAVYQARENHGAAFEAYEKAAQIKDITPARKIGVLDKLVDLSLIQKNYAMAVQFMEALKQAPDRYAGRADLDRQLEIALRLQTAQPESGKK